MNPVATPAQAQPEGPNCDAYRQEYEVARGREASLFIALLALVYATAVFVIIAAAAVIFNLQNAQVASAGVGLFGSLSAGGIATLYWQARKATLDRLHEWTRKCPDAAASLAQILETR